MTEISKELLSKVLEAIEVAKATGKIKKGINETTKAIERAEAKLVVYAKNTTPPEIVLHISVLAKEKNVPCVEIPTKEDLGAAAGLPVSTSSIAIVKEGDAKDTIKKIAEELAKNSSAGN